MDVIIHPSYHYCLLISQEANWLRVNTYLLLLDLSFLNLVDPAISARYKHPVLGVVTPLNCDENRNRFDSNLLFDLDTIWFKEYDLLMLCANHQHLCPLFLI